METPTSRNQKPKEPSKPSTPIRELALMVSFPKPLKPWVSTKPLHSPAFLTFLSKHPRSLMAGATPLLPQWQKHPHSRSKPIQAHWPDVCCLQSAWSYFQREDACSFIRIFIIDVAAAQFSPPTLNPDQPPRGRRIDYKMARLRECGWPDQSRLLKSFWFGHSSSPST